MTQKIQHTSTLMNGGDIATLGMMDMIIDQFFILIELTDRDSHKLEEPVQ